MHLGADLFTHALVEAQECRLLALLQLLNLLDHVAATLVSALQIKQRLVQGRRLHIADLVVRVQIFKARRGQPCDARLQVLGALEAFDFLAKATLLLFETLDR